MTASATGKTSPVFRDAAVPRRIAELDSLRGVLAVSIVIFHLYMQPLFFLWSCVDGFLVLSGFVITRLLLCNSASTRTLINFYARRALRIWPVYFLTMGVALCLHCGYALKNGIPLSTIKGIPQSLLFVQFVQFYWRPYSEYFTYDYIRWFGHSWSLAVEEQFYWVWPFVIFAAAKKMRLVACACVVFLLIGLWTRSTGHLIFLFAARADGLALGALLAMLELYLKDHPPLFIKLRPLLITGSVVVAGLCLALLLKIYILPNYKAAVVLNLHYQDSTWLVPLFAMVFAALVACLWLLQGTSLLRPLRSGFLLWLGARSYAIYMFHPPVQAVMERVAEHLAWPYFSAAILTVSSTLLLAHLSFVYIESRFATFRHRFPLAPPPRGSTSNG